MATGFPKYKFVLGNKKPILYIGGYQLLFNRMKVNDDGDKTAYFYCVNKVKHGVFCSSSAKAMVVLDDAADQLFMVSGHFGEILWRPLVYVYQPDKYQETYEQTFHQLSGE